MRCMLFLLMSGLLSAQSFEVASIKPAPPQEMGRISVRRSTDKGLLRYSNVSIADIVAEGYRILHRQVSGPDWMETQRFDIVATFPAGVTEKSVPEMLKSLLEERFGLKVHEESKEMSVYAIMPARSGVKMKQAEKPGNFSGHNSTKLATINATATMERLADNLSTTMDRPVVDRSGLEGAWVIDLQWTPDSSGAPIDDATAPTIFTAMQEQLGLRLVATRSPVRFIVVDHVERTPSEN
jgi:uncharacterized protein (TIGR03435 family)